MRNKIAACMMIRGEEPELERGLSSIRDEVDKICVIYTGIVEIKPDSRGMIQPSCDMRKTERDDRLFKKFRCVVRDSMWSWSFGAHRNEAFLLAKHCGCDWGLVIDADEVLDIPKNGLREHVSGREFHATYHFGLKNLLAHGIETIAWQVRFVSLHSGAHYKERIHNKLFVPGYQEVSPRIANAFIVHDGYGRPAPELEYKINHRIYLCGHLMQEAGTKTIRRSWRERLRDKPWQATREVCKKPELLFYLASLYERARQHDMALKLLDDYVAGWGPTPDLLSLRADIERKKGMPKKAIKTYEELQKLSPWQMDAYFYAAMLKLATPGKNGLPLDVKGAERLLKKHKELAEVWAKAPGEYPCIEEIFTHKRVGEGQKLLAAIKQAIAERRKIEFGGMLGGLARVSIANAGTSPGTGWDGTTKRLEGR